MINPIAHEMSSGHSSMGEYSRAIPPPVALHPVVVSPSDVVPLRQLGSPTHDVFARFGIVADSHNYEVRRFKLVMERTCHCAQRKKQRKGTVILSWVDIDKRCVVLEAQ